jgi:hypothetical protein
MISAIGIGVRHAVARALATGNLAMADATFRVRKAHVRLDERRRVVRGEATLEILKPHAVGDWSKDDIVGVVNPDGEHPLMAYVSSDGVEAPRRGFFLDIFPVTWDRWLRQVDDNLPDVDPLCPRTDVEHSVAVDFAATLRKRLPTSLELRLAWGLHRYPWGDAADPELGRVGRPRFDVLPEVGLHPPNAFGLFDIGAWLWQWTAEGLVFGGATDEVPGAAQEPGPHHVPLGIRLAQDA